VLVPSFGLLAVMQLLFGKKVAAIRADIAQQNPSNPS
jgi:hypothetical protein